jgi:hypothetical protein
MIEQKAKAQVLNKEQKQVCNSYIDQSYLLNKYQTLKADTKELVNNCFDMVKQNIIILSNTRYIQKIERTQRRFDSKSFTDYVNALPNNKSNNELKMLVNGFYKSIKVLELKPFDDKLESEKRTTKKGELKNAK